MKKIFLILAAVIVVAIAAVVIVVQMQPDDFHYSRSITINAPAATVFLQVNNLHKWQDWSPWVELDPNVKITYDGPEEGVGASYAWAGNRNMGKGRMTVVESKPAELVGFRLEFLEPFAATNSAEFSFKPAGNQTVVTWTMAGKCNFLNKAMGLVLDCEKMIGNEFDKGLAKMKKVVESGGKN